MRRWLSVLRRWWRRQRPKYGPGALQLVHGRWHDQRMAEDHDA